MNYFELRMYSSVIKGGTRVLSFVRPETRTERWLSLARETIGFAGDILFFLYIIGETIWSMSWEQYRALKTEENKLMAGLIGIIGVVGVWLYFCVETVRLAAVS